MQKTGHATLSPMCLLIFSAVKFAAELFKMPVDPGLKCFYSLHKRDMAKHRSNDMRHDGGNRGAFVGTESRQPPWPSSKPSALKTTAPWHLPLGRDVMLEYGGLGEPGRSAVSVG